MDDSQTDPALHLAARALALVLDLEADDLRADSPLDDLGADTVARVQWADAVEALSLADGMPVVVDDDALAAASSLGDLAGHLSAQLPVAAPR